MPVSFDAVISRNDSEKIGKADLVRGLQPRGRQGQDERLLRGRPRLPNPRSLALA